MRAKLNSTLDLKQAKTHTHTAMNIWVGALIKAQHFLITRGSPVGVVEGHFLLAAAEFYNHFA